MQRPTTVGLLHPGQMGAAVAAAIVAAGHPVRWCAAGRSAATGRRAAAAGLTAVPDLAALVDAADVVLSICPPAAAEELAGAVADTGYAGLFVEANAVAVARMERIAARLRGVGARVVDASIIGPPPVDGRTARLHLAGDPADVAAVAALVEGGPVRPVTLGDGIGAASALKMAFAGYQKATRALAAVAHGLAAHHGVTTELLAEAARMPSDALADPGYVPSVAARAWRWGPEMREVAATLAAAGLPTELATAAAAVLARWEPDRDREMSLEQALAALAGHRAPRS